MWIFLPYIKYYSKMSWKFYQQFAKTRLFSSGENEQVPDLIIRKGKVLVTVINGEQAIWTLFLAELIKVLW